MTNSTQINIPQKRTHESANDLLLRTPLIKVFENNDLNNLKIFYTHSEYDKWFVETVKSGEILKYGKPTYYMGLGTSSEKNNLTVKDIITDFDDDVQNSNKRKIWIDNFVNGHK